MSGSSTAIPTGKNLSITSVPTPTHSLTHSLVNVSSKPCTPRTPEYMAFFATSGESPESADRPSAVHHRIGFPCQDCDDEVRSVEYRRYTVAYCPTCQTGGKEIADNTTSKFLK